MMPPCPPRIAGADQRRHLLALREIALDRCDSECALERHDSLIALIGRRQIESDREIALAEQLLQIEGLAPSVGEAAPRRAAHSRAARRRDSRTPAG